MATQYGGYTLQSRTYRWQDWAILVLAIWLFVSPWVLQFGAGALASPAGTANGPTVAVSHAGWDAWVLGIIVFLVAVSAIGSIQVWQEYWNLILGSVDLCRTLGARVRRARTGELGSLAGRRGDLSARTREPLAAAQHDDHNCPAAR
jgi:hypothetical protein